MKLFDTFAGAMFAGGILMIAGGVWLIAGSETDVGMGVLSILAGFIGLSVVTISYFTDK